MRACGVSAVPRRRRAYVRTQGPARLLPLLRGSDRAHAEIVRPRGTRRNGRTRRPHPRHLRVLLTHLRTDTGRGGVVCERGSWGRAAPPSSAASRLTPPPPLRSPTPWRGSIRRPPPSFSSPPVPVEGTP